MPDKFKSLNEFYAYYLTEHLNKNCRRCHFIGTTLVIALLLTGITTGFWWCFALMPAVGYGFAWVGHFTYEKNKPAAFQHPIYSLASDFIMYWHTITFQLEKKLDRVRLLVKE